MFVVLFSSDQLESAGISDLYSFHKDFGKVSFIPSSWLFLWCSLKKEKSPLHGKKHSGDSHKQLSRDTGADSQDNFWAGLDPDSHNRQKTQVTGQQEEVLWFLSLVQPWWMIGDWVDYECIWSDCTASFTRQRRQVFVFPGIFSVDKSNKCSWNHFLLLR